FKKPGLKAGKAILPAPGRRPGSGPFVGICPPGILKIEHVGRAEEGFPEWAKKKDRELGRGEEDEVEFLPPEQAPPFPEKERPGPKADIPDSESARPTKGHGVDADDPNS